MSEAWSQELALTWTDNVAPSRPTVCELAILTSWLRRLQVGASKPLHVLILGSTPEYRDWAFEEALEITVRDYSVDYHSAINRELRHKNLNYALDIGRWEDMDYVDRFDLIVGDLTIGNIDSNRLEEFIARMARGLRPGGLIFGKNVFRDAAVPRAPEQLLADYYQGHPYHPYSALVHELTMATLGDDDHLDFSKLAPLLEDLHLRGLLKRKEYDVFIRIGIGSHFDFRFFVPTIARYEAAVLNAGLKIESVAHTDDVFTKFFPLYILKKERL